MKNKVKKYVDNLFSDIHDTKQLKELKEEVSANLLEKVNDFIINGNSEDDAFNKAVSSLGDMSELVESLKKVSYVKVQENNLETPTLDKKRVIGYVIASAILLFGIMTAGINYLVNNDLVGTTGTLMPFTMVAVGLFVYLGLTQETKHDYGMNNKRALAYTLASLILLFGLFVSGLEYFQGLELYAVLSSFMVFTIPSIMIFIYLGLTEKSRRKMDSDWQKQWVDYYSDPRDMMLRGNISGALWIFAIAAFLLVGFTLGWWYSLIVFIVTVGCEVLIEIFFASRRKV
jgi:hypothetical protein